MFESLPAPRHWRNAAALPKPPPAARRVLPPAMLAAARAEILQWRGYAPTPLVALPALARLCGVGEVRYKDEGGRFGLGSFKALGGAYALLLGLADLLGLPPAAVRRGGARARAAKITAVAATDGNHGRAVAWGAQRFGCQCEIYIHAQVSENRAAAMREFGARVVRIDGDYDDSVREAAARAEHPQRLLISDFSQDIKDLTTRRVMAGYTVMAGEARAAWRASPTHVFLPAGVGGLAAAVMASFCRARRRPRFVVVESNLADCLWQSAKRGAPAVVDIKQETLMAGLSCGEPSAPAWEIIRHLADDFLSIDDALVAPAMRMAAAGEGGNPPITAGECAVAGWAALAAAAARPPLAAALGLGGKSRVLLIGSEGATDAQIYRRLIGGG